MVRVFDLRIENEINFGICVKGVITEFCGRSFLDFEGGETRVEGIFLFTFRKLELLRQGYVTIFSFYIFKDFEAAALD